MKQLRLLKTTFDLDLNSRDLPAFRGSFAEAVGLENELFHNHSNKDNSKKLHYRYPLVQYKINNFKPMLVFLDDAVEEAHCFFTKPDWKISMYGKRVPLKIERLDLKQYNLQVYEKQFYYNIYRYQALNQRNFEAYMELENLSEKIAFLEQKITAHLLSMAKGIGWFLEKRLEVKVTEIIRRRELHFKGIKVLTFDLAIKTNVFIPEFVGIGKAVSHGFGVVRNRRQPRNTQNNIGEAAPAALAL